MSRGIALLQVLFFLAVLALLFQFILQGLATLHQTAEIRMNRSVAFEGFELARQLAARHLQLLDEEGTVLEGQPENNRRFLAYRPDGTRQLLESDRYLRPINFPDERSADIRWSFEVNPAVIPRPWNPRGQVWKVPAREWWPVDWPDPVHRDPDIFGRVLDNESRIQFQAYPHTATLPVLEDWYWIIGVFASGPPENQRAKVRIRYHLVTRWWNPYRHAIRIHDSTTIDYPLQLESETGLSFRLRNLTNGALSPWRELDVLSNDQTGETGVFAWIELPGLIPPGERLTTISPDPGRKPEGLARTLLADWPVRPADEVEIEWKPIATQETRLRLLEEGRDAGAVLRHWRSRAPTEGNFRFEPGAFHRGRRSLDYSLEEAVLAVGWSAPAEWRIQTDPRIRIWDASGRGDVKPASIFPIRGRNATEVLPVRTGHDRLPLLSWPEASPDHWGDLIGRFTGGLSFLTGRNGLPSKDLKDALDRLEPSPDPKALARVFNPNEPDPARWEPFLQHHFHEERSPGEINHLATRLAAIARSREIPFSDARSWVENKSVRDAFRGRSTGYSARPGKAEWIRPLYACAGVLDFFGPAFEATIRVQSGEESPTACRLNYLVRYEGFPVEGSHPRTWKITHQRAIPAGDRLQDPPETAPRLPSAAPRAGSGETLLRGAGPPPLRK